MTLEELKTKYNIGIKKDSEGWKGNNYHLSKLENKEIKKFVNKVLKEVKEVYPQFSYAVNYRDSYYSQKIKVIIKGDESNLFKDFEDLPSPQYTIMYSWQYEKRFKADLKGFKEMYNNYIKRSENAPEKAYKEDLKKIYDFVSDLLKSLSYNYSNAMIDYFDSGICYEIKVLSNNAFKTLDESIETYNKYMN